MFGKLDHIGHVVKNFDEALEFYKKKFDLEPNRVIELSEFGSRMAFFPLGDIEIELIQPGGRRGDPAAICLKERGEGVFHLSFRTDDYDAEVKKWREKGFKVEEYSHSIPGQNVRLAFLSPEETKGLWIEFLKREAT